MSQGDTMPPRKFVALAAMAIVLMAVGFVLGSARASTGEERAADGSAVPVATTVAAIPTLTISSTTATPTTADIVPADIVPADDIAADQSVMAGETAVTVDGQAIDLTGWAVIVDGLRPVAMPSTCVDSLSEPDSLPNAGREYRNGIHMGVDFICEVSGERATAALDGRVVTAVSNFVDPSPDERAAALGVAAETPTTPRWTLPLLYGNFVVLDHGVIDGRHVVSLSAHLDSVNDLIRPGAWVEQGADLGEIGNKGTSTASSGAARPRSIHLHWELFVDGQFVGAGLSAAETEQLYRSMFSTP